MTRTLKNTKKGQAVITAVVLFLAGALIIVSGAAAPVLKDVKEIRTFTETKRSYLLAEGGLEDVIYRHKNGITVSDSEVLSEDGVVTTTVTVVAGSTKEVTAEGIADDLYRKAKVVLTADGEGVAFNYGVQVGEGGLVLTNTASVEGNVYSNGSVDGATLLNDISGDVIAAGPGRFIDRVDIGGSAYADTIQNADVSGDAYYQTLTNTTVGGTLYPGSDPQATAALPISDEQIEGWEADAEAGGIITSPCPYRIKDDETIGPVRIDCDLEISGDPTVTLAGHVWVRGNISTSNTMTAKVASSLGASSVALIADNPSDRVSSSKVSFSNSSMFVGSGSSGSYILVVSMNNDAEENGGSKIAITLQNSAQGDLLLYAPHGSILLQNSANIKEVSGWKLRLSNGAKVVYESGLANLLFTSGPSGGFDIESWREVE